MIAPPMTTKVKSFSRTWADFLAELGFRQPLIRPMLVKMEPFQLVFIAPEPKVKMLGEVVGAREVGEALDTIMDHAQLAKAIRRRSPRRCVSGGDVCC